MPSGFCPTCFPPGFLKELANKNSGKYVLKLFVTQKYNIAKFIKIYDILFGGCGICTVCKCLVIFNLSSAYRICKNYTGCPKNIGIMGPDHQNCKLTFLNIPRSSQKVPESFKKKNQFGNIPSILFKQI